MSSIANGKLCIKWYLKKNWQNYHVLAEKKNVHENMAIIVVCVKCFYVTTY